MRNKDISHKTLLRKRSCTSQDTLHMINEVRTSQDALYMRNKVVHHKMVYI